VAWSRERQVSASGEIMDEDTPFLIISMVEVYVYQSMGDVCYRISGAWILRNNERA